MKTAMLLSTLFVLAVLGSSPLFAEDEPVEAVKWQTEYLTGLKAAATAKKLMFIEFTAVW
jgi:hypothetical protein